MAIKGSTVYVDQNGFHVYVSDGIANGDYFFTVRRDALKKKGEKRICSPDLPHRKTIEEAQADLDTYAQKKIWPKLEESNAAKKTGPVTWDDLLSQMRK